MVESIRRGVVVVVAGSLAYAGAAFAQPAPSDPPGRVGRLAFVSGSVSFHDDQESQWTQALVNSPLTTGDALWTEPNARSEISIAGTRVRMDSATQLDLLAIDDSRTRLQIDQGRIDIKTYTYDTHQPYEIVTPRGIVTLQQQGDYYVEAGSTQDATRLGVRQGAAQIQAPNGQVMAVRAGEMAEITGDTASPQLHTIPSAPPPMPTYWAERDRQVVYEQPPQYLSAELTGYEDLNYYGGWSNDPEYGQVWSPRSVPAGWEPYRTGRWSYVQPWGWTWVDEQPWGFAPYHYGRWAHRNDRWFWVPPERQQRPVYAPALVAFVGGVELSIALGNQSAAPVGWFPLGPREVYVPPYTTNRDYYRRINVAARVQEQMLNDRWERAQRREAITDAREQQMMNRRFATIVPAQAFTRSEPVARVALKVDPQKVAAAPVAPVAAPPAPTQSIRALQAAPNAAQGNNAPGTAAPGNKAPGAAIPPGSTPQTQAQAQVQAQAQAHGNIAAAPTRFANMQALAKPSDKEAERPKAPGPKIASRPAANSNEPNAKPNLPTLAPRNPNAPPPAQPAAPSQAQQPNAPQPNAQQPNGPRPNGPQANAPANQAQQPSPPAGQPQPGAKPGTPPAPPAAQQQHPQPGPGQANLPPVRGPQGQRPDAPHQDQARPNEPRPKEAPRAPAQAQQPPHNEQARPSQAAPAPQAPAAQPQQRPAPPPAAPQREGRAPEAQPQRAPQQAMPQPQHQAPAPQPQHQQAAPAPQPQQHAAPPAPPQQAHAPAPQPAPQPQRAAPAPQPQQHAAPPAPPQQAHAPAPAPQPQHAAPPPQQHQQQAQQPAPHPGGGGQPQKKDDDKK